MKLNTLKNYVRISELNRFDLEDAMSKLYCLSDEIDDIMFAYADSDVKPTEDAILNMLIGIKQLHETRYQRMWQIFEQLIKNKTIKSPVHEAQNK